MLLAVVVSELFFPFCMNFHSIMLQELKYGLMYPSERHVQNSVWYNHDNFIIYSYTK